jgi:type II secretory pathway component PulF
MVSSAVPLRRALQVSVEQCMSARFREALRSVTSDIEVGSALSTAMERRPGEFARVHVAMIRAGELSGSLGEILDRIATLLERDQAVRKRVSSAFAYPAVVLAAAMLLILFLVADAVPAFGAMFAQMHVALPPLTAALIEAGKALQSPLSWLLLVVLGLVAAAAPGMVRRQAAASLLVDRLVLRIPLFGRIVRTATIGRLARTLGILLRCGVPLLAALGACAEVVDNRVYETSLQEVEASLRQGYQLTASLDNLRLYDPLFMQLVRVGEESGSLDVMLLKIAEYCDVEIETALSALSSIVEPTLILVLGAVVGTIVASILIPLYSIIGSIK